MVVVVVVVLGLAMNVVDGSIPGACGLMGGCAARAAVLEESGRFLLLVTAETAVLDWVTIFVAGPGGG